MTKLLSLGLDRMSQESIRFYVYEKLETPGKEVEPEERLEIHQLEETCMGLRGVCEARNMI